MHINVTIFQVKPKILLKCHAVRDFHFILPKCTCYLPIFWLTIIILQPTERIKKIFPGTRDNFCWRGEPYFRTLQYDFNKFEFFRVGGPNPTNPFPRTLPSPSMPPPPQPHTIYIHKYPMKNYCKLIYLQLTTFQRPGFSGKNISDGYFFMLWPSYHFLYGWSRGDKHRKKKFFCIMNVYPDINYYILNLCL